VTGITPGLAAALGIALAACAAHAQPLPPLRAGLWEVSRTVEAPTGTGTPQIVRTTECEDPNEAMAARQQMLTRIGCTLAPMEHAGNTYTFSAICGEGGAETSKSVLIVESDSAYSIRIESTVGGAQSQELLRATRVGDCPP